MTDILPPWDGRFKYCAVIVDAEALLLETSKWFERAAEDSHINPAFGIVAHSEEL